MKERRYLLAMSVDAKFDLKVDLKAALLAVKLAIWFLLLQVWMLVVHLVD